LPGGCAAEVQAVLDAVATLGFPIKSIQIEPGGWPCGAPFFDPAAAACPGPLTGGPTVYVDFFGTDKEAALDFTVRADGTLVANVLEFRVPPSGPAPA
jgi:hypothetical protein